MDSISRTNNIMKLMVRVASIIVILMAVAMLVIYNAVAMSSEGGNCLGEGGATVSMLMPNITLKTHALGGHALCAWAEEKRHLRHTLCHTLCHTPPRGMAHLWRVVGPP